MSAPLPGLHHVTAIASDPQQNIDFYTRVLGLRLVKLTVNFDDPTAYHLYYGDSLGRPGTIVTFFTWPRARRGRQGNGQITAFSFAVPEASLDFWRDRLASEGVAVAGPFRRFDETALAFADRDGMALEIVAGPDVTDWPGWSTGVTPPEHALRRVAGVTITHDDVRRTDAMISGAMGFAPVSEEQDRRRFRVGAGRDAVTVDLVTRPGGPRGLQAAGTVHHVAYRVTSDEHELAWQQALRAAGVGVTPVRDRQYFRSVYFTEPNGVLFELATDPPGFTADESPDQLGSGLKLPPWLEPHRPAIARALPSLSPVRV